MIAHFRRRYIFLTIVITLLCVQFSDVISNSTAAENFTIPSSSSDESGGFINFSFDQVDVSTFVKLVGEITGRKFVLSEGVGGKITVVSPRIKRKEVYPLFVSILESAGCSVIKDGDLHRIVSLPKRATLVTPVIGTKSNIPAEGIITKIFRPKYIRVAELKKFLEARVSGGKNGAVATLEETNHLIINDTADSIRKIEKIIDEIDQPGLTKIIEIVSLKYADPANLADQLNLAMSEKESRGERLRKRLPGVRGRQTRRNGVAVIASPHSNSLVLTGTSRDIIELKRIIKKMDIDTPSGRGHLNAIFLKYISSEEAAKSLNALLSRQSDKNKTVQSKKIAIEASVVNNALLVDASPADYDVIKKLVDQLDRIPQQVHISVIIAEHSINDDLDIGVEMTALDMPAKIGSTIIYGSSKFAGNADSLLNNIQKGIFPKGITVGVAHGAHTDNNGNITANFPGLVNINAIRKNGRIKIRSETSLETQNNREASVSIVNEIPILKSTVQGGSGTARDIIQNIERTDVGIKLKLTPHIIPDGEVQMDLNTSIEAVIDYGSSDTRFTPTIAKREVLTTVTVPDGKMIVIAGLTREDKTKVIKKIPILGSIPLLGWLFRHTVDTKEKTNLLILVTPRIVTNIAEAEDVMEDWKNKTNLKAYEEK